MLTSVTDPTGKGRITILRDSLLRASAVLGVEVDLGTGGTTNFTRTEFGYNDATGWVNLTRRVVTPTTGGSATDDETQWVRNFRGQVIDKRMKRDSADSNFERGYTADYDGLGRLLKVQDKLSATHSNQVSYAYEDETGRLESRTSVEAEELASSWGLRAYLESYGYDSLDRMVTTTRYEDATSTLGDPPALIAHTYEYDSLSHRVEFEDSMGAKLRWEFDGLGREVAKDETGGLITIRTTCDYVMNAANWSVLKTEATGFTTKLIYDDAGRLAQKQNPGFNASTGRNGMTYQYDDTNRVERTIDGRGANVLCVYDAASRLIERKLDPALPIPFAVSRLAVAETIEYDAIGRRVGFDTHSQGVYTGALAEVTDDWDTLNRKTSTDFAFLPAVYTNDDSVLGVESGFLLSNGTDQDFHYRRTLKTSGDGVGTNFQIGITPDALGRMQSSTLGVAGGTAQPLADYRFVGSRVLHRSSHVHGNGAVNIPTTKGWDGQERLATWTTSASGSGTAFAYYQYHHNDEGRILRKVYDKVGITPPSGSVDGDAFELDDVYRLVDAKLGMVTSDPDPDNTSYSSLSFHTRREFGYDLGQSRAHVTETIAGNSSTDNYALQTDSSRYVTAGGASLAYDGAGNCIDDGRYVYKYDFRNRLSEVYEEAYAESWSSSSSSPSPSGRTTLSRTPLTEQKIGNFYRNFTATHQPTGFLDPRAARSRVPLRESTAELTRSGSGSSQSQSGEGDVQLELVAYYGYDVDNRRVIRMLNDEGLVTHCSSYDGWNEFEESILSYNSGNAAWTKVRAFIWGYQTDELLRYAAHDGSNWKEFTTVQDERSNVVRLIDDEGDQIERYEFGPYGELQAYNETAAPFSELPYLYTGRRYDPETQLYYFRNRYYSTQLGRFITMDPQGQWADPFSAGNPYAFLGNAAIDFADPLGLQVKTTGHGSGLPQLPDPRELGNLSNDRDFLEMENVLLRAQLKALISRAELALAKKERDEALDDLVEEGFGLAGGSITKLLQKLKKAFKCVKWADEVVETGAGLKGLSTDDLKEIYAPHTKQINKFLGKGPARTGAAGTLDGVPTEAIKAYKEITLRNLTNPNAVGNKAFEAMPVRINAIDSELLRRATGG